MRGSRRSVRRSRTARPNGAIRARVSLTVSEQHSRALPRRSARRGTAGGSRAALAARFTIDPRARASRVLPRFDDNARVLPGGLPDARGRRPRRPVSDLGVGVAARQLPSDQRADRRRAAQSAEPLLSATAAAGVPRTRRTRAHLRHGHRARPPQRQPARSAAARGVPEPLPADLAADDRRAVGVAEHADPRARREPAPAGRRDPAIAPGARHRRRLSSSAPRSAGRPTGPPGSSWRRSCSCCCGRASTACAAAPLRRVAGRRSRRRGT